MRFALFCLVFLLACSTTTTSGSTAVLGDRVFSLEIADTPSEQAQGLMFRKTLDSDAGMLFVFDESKTRTFWMKNTTIPLDILFLDDAYKVVTLYRNVSPCIQAPCELYSSLVPISYALEINAGAAPFVKEGDLIIVKR